MGTYFHYGQKNQSCEKLNTLSHISLIGAGTMGIGIAIDLLNKTRCQIDLIDVSDQALMRAQNEIESYLKSEIKQGRIWADHFDSLFSRLHFTKDYGVLKEAQIIWEVATEDVGIKRVIFELIEKSAQSDRLLFVFSNTSSHTTSELAILFNENWLRERFLTGHGYFPFHANRLFDVMKGQFATEEVFQMGVAFSEQILEKKTIALRKDHHGYITDPIFQAMGAIVSWDVKRGEDLVELPLVFQLLTANPFEVLDQTGHMPFTKSAIHMGQALPQQDRLRSLYQQEGRFYPKWIEDLEKSGRIGVSSKEKEGFFKWEGRRAVAVYDPSTGGYIRREEPNWKEYWSIQESKMEDHQSDTIQSIQGLLRVAQAEDRAGRCFRRYVMPLMLYALDLIQDEYASADQINASTKVGLRFKFGLCEIIDGFIAHFGIDSFMAFVRRCGRENPDRTELFDLEGAYRDQRPHLLFEMKEKGWTSLLGYGRIYHTPVSYREFSTGEWKSYLNDLKFVPPNEKDRVGTIIFDNPLKGNVWNKALLDQLDHVLGLATDLYERGLLGALLFTSTGTNMRLLGADARQFNRGWFDAKKGYQFLGEEEAASMTRSGMALFRYLQESPIWTVGAFGEKWGGGAEFTYFLNQRFDLKHFGVEYDPIDKKSVYCEKKNYNQPEIEYAILGGFGAVQELRRLGFGDSLIDEIFMQGMTASRAHQIGLSNGVHDSESKLLEWAYEVARKNQKYAAPYSALLYHKQKRDAFLYGIDDEKLVKEAGETFNPEKNPYIERGILRLLNRGKQNPPMDLAVRGSLPKFKQNYRELVTAPPVVKSDPSGALVGRKREEVSPYPSLN